MAEEEVRRRIEKMERSTLRGNIIIRGMFKEDETKRSFRDHFVSCSLKDRLVEALSGVGTVPSFTIERMLGVSGAAELVLDRVDDKYAFFNHQKSPIVRSRGISFEDSLTQGELGERQALLPQKDRLKREGLKPWFMRSVLQCKNLEGRRCL